MGEKKYKFTEETMTYDSVTLHRIEAIRDFGDVKSGDLGGWIEKEQNLSHNGDCWVCGGAKVYGNAKVLGNAWICGDAEIYGEAEVFGDAWVFGEAKVYGEAWVCGNAKILGDAKIFGDSYVQWNVKIGTGSYENLQNISDIRGAELC